MPLDKPTLKQDIRSLLDNLFNNSPDMTPEEARGLFVDGLADAVENYVKSADGQYQPGSLTASNGVVSAVGTVQIKLN
jgi:20S proteasome alpha/beta subunit